MFFFRIFLIVGITLNNTKAGWIISLERPGVPLAFFASPFLCQ